MATLENSQYGLPFPLATDDVNVHGDLKTLVESLEALLPTFGVGYFQINVINDSGETLLAGTPVHAVGYTTRTTVNKSLPATTTPILGLMKQSTADGEEGVCVVAGLLEDINTTSYAVGDVLYVAEGGGLTNSRPESGSGAVGVVAYSATNGIIIVEAKGNGTWGALRDGLA